MSDSNVTVVERNGRHVVRIEYEGGRFADVGRHSSRADAERQAAALRHPSSADEPPPFVPKGKRRSRFITCRACARDVELSVGKCEHCGWEMPGSWALDAVAEATAGVAVSNRPVGTVSLMTTPATKPTKRAAKAAAPSAIAEERRNSRRSVKPADVEPEPAKPTKRASKSSAKLAVVPDVETKSATPKAPKISDEQSTKLTKLNVDALAAVEAFEAFVIELIEAGVSPTTIGSVIERGNSSIRRIAMRRSPGLVK